MQQSMTVALERNTVLSGEFATEPYEVAWAREGRWFIRPLEIKGRNVRMEVHTEISPDGLHWCRLGDETLTLQGQEMLSWPVREFGGWLRIRGVVTGDDNPRIKTVVYLAIKS